MLSSNLTSVLSSAIAGDSSAGDSSAGGSTEGANPATFPSSSQGGRVGPPISAPSLYGLNKQ